MGNKRERSMRTEYRAVIKRRSLNFYNWSLDILCNASAHKVSIPEYNNYPVSINLSLKGKEDAIISLFIVISAIWAEGTCSRVSITHQLEWIPWCSRRLRVLMAMMSRNIFFRNISPCFTGTVGGKVGERGKQRA